jgi:hypothetical protein
MVWYEVVAVFNHNFSALRDPACSCRMYEGYSSMSRGLAWTGRIRLLTIRRLGWKEFVCRIVCCVWGAKRIDRIDVEYDLLRSHKGGGNVRVDVCNYSLVLSIKINDERLLCL